MKSIRVKANDESFGRMNSSFGQDGGFCKSLASSLTSPNLQLPTLQEYYTIDPTEGAEKVRQVQKPKPTTRQKMLFGVEKSIIGFSKVFHSFDQEKKKNTQVTDHMYTRSSVDLESIAYRLEQQRSIKAFSRQQVFVFHL